MLLTDTATALGTEEGVPVLGTEEGATAEEEGATAEEEGATAEEEGATELGTEDGATGVYTIPYTLDAKLPGLMDPDSCGTCTLKLPGRLPFDTCVVKRYVLSLSCVKLVNATGLPLVVVTTMSEAVKPLTGRSNVTMNVFVRELEEPPLETPSLDVIVGTDTVH